MYFNRLRMRERASGTIATDPWLAILPTSRVAGDVVLHATVQGVVDILTDMLDAAPLPRGAQTYVRWELGTARSRARADACDDVPDTQCSAATGAACDGIPSIPASLESSGSGPTASLPVDGLVPPVALDTSNPSPTFEGMSILRVHSHYANMVVDGTKTWELFGMVRPGDKKFWESRGRIMISELVSSRPKPRYPGCAIGAVQVAQCIWVDRSTFDANVDKHRAADYEPAQAWLDSGRCYAAVLVHAQRFASPVPFLQASGGKWLRYRTPPSGGGAASSSISVVTSGATSSAATFIAAHVDEGGVSPAASLTAATPTAFLADHGGGCGIGAAVAPWATATFAAEISEVATTTTVTVTTTRHGGGADSRGETSSDVVTFINPHRLGVPLAPVLDAISASAVTTTSPTSLLDPAVVDAAVILVPSDITSTAITATAALAITPAVASPAVTVATDPDAPTAFAVNPVTDGDTTIAAANPAFASTTTISSTAPASAVTTVTPTDTSIAILTATATAAATSAVAHTTALAATPGVVAAGAGSTTVTAVMPNTILTAVTPAFGTSAPSIGSPATIAPRASTIAAIPASPADDTASVFASVPCRASIVTPGSVLPTTVSRSSGALHATQSTIDYEYDWEDGMTMEDDMMNDDLLLRERQQAQVQGGEEVQTSVSNDTSLLLSPPTSKHDATAATQDLDARRSEHVSGRSAAAAQRRASVAVRSLTFRDKANTVASTTLSSSDICDRRTSATTKGSSGDAPIIEAVAASDDAIAAHDAAVRAAATVTSDTSPGPVPVARLYISKDELAALVTKYGLILPSPSHTASERFEAYCAAWRHATPGYAAGFHPLPAQTVSRTPIAVAIPQSTPPPTTAELRDRLTGPIAPDYSSLESMCFWNAASWFCGDPATQTVEGRLSAQRRYDALEPILGQTTSAPTYLAISEISGGIRDFTSEHGLKEWLMLRGYASTYVPGPPNRSGSGQLGGFLLAWRHADVQPLVTPCADRGAVLVVADFRHRQQPRDTPPTRVGSAYGRQRRGGKLRVVRAIADQVAAAQGVIIAGDLNVTPSCDFQISARARTQADDEFSDLTNGGRPSDTSPVAIVPLGFRHTVGEFSRVTWQQRLACGARRGTATVDHAVVAGAERGAWEVHTRMHLQDADGLISDHALVIVVRRPRAAVSDGGGVYRPPRFRLEFWAPWRQEKYKRTCSRELRVLTDGSHCERTLDGCVRHVQLGDGATAMDQLVAIVNAAAIHASLPCTSTEADRLGRVGKAGGDERGLRSQVKRCEGLLRTVRRAATEVQHVRSRVSSARDGSASTSSIDTRARTTAHQRVCDAEAAEAALYNPKSSVYLGRHSGSIERAIWWAKQRCAAWAAHAATSEIRAAVDSCIRRELSYFSTLLSKCRRRDDAEVWRGLREAKDASSPEARRDIIVKLMSKRQGTGQGGVRGFLMHDKKGGEWISDPGKVRSGIGAIQHPRTGRSQRVGFWEEEPTKGPFCARKKMYPTPPPNHPSG